MADPWDQLHNTLIQVMVNQGTLQGAIDTLLAAQQGQAEGKVKAGDIISNPGCNCSSSIMPHKTKSRQMSPKKAKRVWSYQYMALVSKPAQAAKADDKGPEIDIRVNTIQECKDTLGTLTLESCKD
ncbi:hypothetical protein V8B97DRAFT_1917136 [Scleroderma yunnanense]